MAAFVPEALSYMTGNHSVSEYALSSGSNLSKMEAAPGWQYPFCVLEVQPLSAKYAEDLSHRDYLGSVLALGIERSKLGDLIVSDTSASIFCSDAIASFICQELTRVRHTDVTCTFSDADSVTIEPAFEERTGSVASLRLDSLIALTFGIPRARAAQAVSQGAVSVNAKIVTSNGHPPQDGDRISVRGLGKCRFRGVLHQTKKGRLIVRMERFV
ncbi:MAG: RNA-binding protein [Eubacterium sp.]|nr:RNA-binding protein [Eubacterium sp.]